jgi:hypothetical protein
MQKQKRKQKGPGEARKTGYRNFDIKFEKNKRERGI